MASVFLLTVLTEVLLPWMYQSLFCCCVNTPWPRHLWGERFTWAMVSEGLSGGEHGSKQQAWQQEQEAECSPLKLRAWSRNITLNDLRLWNTCVCAYTQTHTHPHWIQLVLPMYTWVYMVYDWPLEHGQLTRGLILKESRGSCEPSPHFCGLLAGHDMTPTSFTSYNNMYSLSYTVIPCL